MATDVDQHEGTGTCEPDNAGERRLRANESGCVGTNLEPEAVALSPTIRRRPQRPTTYRDIRAYVSARHGFSPRTGWIAHVKELSGLPLRPTLNRHGATRVDPCPPERRAAIAEALRHFRTL